MSNFARLAIHEYLVLRNKLIHVEDLKAINMDELENYIS